MSPVLLGIGAVVVMGILWWVSLYNGLIALRNSVDQAWSNIDVLLKQRFDELPKLVDVCSRYMQHEKEIFDSVLKARSAMAGVVDKKTLAQADQGMTQALGRLFAVAENYPDLKSEKSFQQLQSRISDIESSIADRREYFNEAVTILNTRIESIPDVFVARSIGIQRQEQFRATAPERQDVKLKFS